VGPKSQSGPFGEKKNLMPVLGFEPQANQPVNSASNQTVLEQEVKAKYVYLIRP
jgi:hypothetical protein